jgi:hypothetical protein
VVAVALVFGVSAGPAGIRHPRALAAGLGWAVRSLDSIDDRGAVVKPAITRALLLAGFGAGALVAGCGGDAQRTATTTAATTGTASVPAATVGAARRRPIPRVLRTAESAAEDTIDLALAGKRRRVVEKADALKAVAHGPAGPALRAAGVSGSEIAAFRARADEVARLAPGGELLQVALASNRAFGLIAGFFAHFESPVPAAVTALDHLDFEAKLEAKAGNAAALRSAVDGLDRTWSKLRADVVKAGGARVASKFDAHVERMRRLAGVGGSGAVKEAQHGLDLVDELEAVYNR